MSPYKIDISKLHSAVNTYFFAGIEPRLNRLLQPCRSQLWERHAVPLNDRLGQAFNTQLSDTIREHDRLVATPPTQIRRLSTAAYLARYLESFGWQQNFESLESQLSDSVESELAHRTGMLLCNDVRVRFVPMLEQSLQQAIG
jgi:hypothetical protein